MSQKKIQKATNANFGGKPQTSQPSAQQKGYEPLQSVSAFEQEDGHSTTNPDEQDPALKVGIKIDLNQSDDEHSETEQKVARSSQGLQRAFNLSGFVPITATDLKDVEQHKELIQKTRIQTVGPLFHSLQELGIIDAATKELKTDAALQKKSFKFKDKSFTFKVAPDAQTLASYLLKLVEKKRDVEFSPDDQRDFHWCLSKAISWMIEQSVENLTEVSQMFIAEEDKELIVSNGKKYLRKTVDLEKVNRLMNSNGIDFKKLLFVKSPFSLRFKHFNTQKETGKEFPLFVGCARRASYLQQMQWQLKVADAMERGLICLNQHPAPLTVVSIMFSVYFGINEIGYVERIGRNKKSREIQKALRGLTRKQLTETEEEKASL